MIGNRRRFFIILFLWLFLMSFVEPNTYSAATRPSLSASEIWEQMLAAQSGLMDFSAQIRLTSKLGILPLPTLTGEISAKRPSQVKAKIAGITFQPQHPFLFPDPLQFVGDDYDLTLLETITSENKNIYKIAVIPTTPEAELLNMHFWISETNWLIIKSDMSMPEIGRTVMEAQYIEAAPNAWVPVRLSGTGGLLLADLLPPSGLGKLMSGFIRSDKVVFTATLSNHQVNIGL